MTERELFRIKSALAEDVGRRTDRLEKKIDAMTEKCVGCSKQFGGLDADVRNVRDAIKDHVAEHRWRVGVAAAIGGVIVAVANFFASLWRNQ